MVPVLMTCAGSGIQVEHCEADYGRFPSDPAIDKQHFSHYVARRQK
jgi:hypothetical protein